MSGERPARAHVLGIGGVGMSGVALLLRQLGVEVTGSDLRESPILDRVRAAGCVVSIGPDPTHAARAEWWIAPDHLPDDHPERVAALGAGVRCLSRDAASAALLGDRSRVLVLGAHGRGLTAALLAAALGGVAGGVGHLVGVLRRDAVPHAVLAPKMVVEHDERGELPPMGVESIVLTELARTGLGHYVDPEDVSRRTLDALVARPHVRPAEPLWSDPRRCVYLAQRGVAEARALEGRIDPGWTATTLTLCVDSGEGSVVLTLPPGPLLAQSACAAAAHAHFIEAQPLDLIARRVEPAAAALVGHMEICARLPQPALHEVRTYPVAIARALDDLTRLGASRVAVLLRPYPPTFTRYPFEAFVEALSAATFVQVLPDYFDDAAPCQAALVEGLRGAVAVTEDDWREGLDGENFDALLAFGGDDLAALLS